jgi:predicted permease
MDLQMLEAVSQDLRLAVRGLRRAKTLAAAAVLILALGIAGTSVMFALIEGVLLRPLPVREQDRLLVAWKEARTSGSAHYPFGGSDIQTVADASHMLVNAAGVSRNGVGRSVVVEDGISTYVNDALVTGSFFAVLGVQPILGRTFTPADDVDGAENVLVISHGLWRRRYGGSPQVIGRRIALSEQSFRIVGVMSPDMDYPAGVEVWRTPRSVPTTGPFGDAARQELDLIGRLRSGVTIAQAEGELAALAARLDANAPVNVPGGLRTVVRSFADVVVGDVRAAMMALFVAVGLVLLIASANVANLLLMRGEARRAEIAVRAALGAGRGRIFRLVFVESLVLALAAGASGLGLSWWSLQTVLNLVPGGLPRLESIRIDAAVVVFAVAIAFVTALLAGLAPALLSMRLDLVSSVRTSARGAAGSATRLGRRTLVVAQVALAVTIVAAAGLLIRSVLNLQSVDLGLAADRLVLVNLDMPQAKYADRARRARFLDDVISQLESAPAVRAVTPVNVSPFTGQGWDLPTFTAEGQSAEQASHNPSLNLESIHPNYFETFAVALRRGRAFTTGDRQGTPDVAIISADVASRIWPGEDPIGKRLKMGGPDAKAPWYTVVGVAAQTRYRDVATPRATLYLPAAQFQMTAAMLVLRTTASLDLLTPLVRDRVRTVDADVHVLRVAHFMRMLDAPLARPRFNAFLLSIFGVAALLLSTVGIYAVMAAFVRQRDREIALRMALGATTTGVRRFVVAEALRLVGVGVAIGLAVATSATRLVRGLLFEVHPLDPSTILGAAALLIVAAALASYLPVRRATRIDATAMLRGE